MSRFSCALIGAALCGGLLPLALAQNAPDASKTAPLAVTKESRKRHLIPLKNVPPSLVAWWLDPKDNPEPPQFRSKRRKSGSQNVRNGPDTSTLPAVALPAGIDQIVAIDPQNALLIFGTDAGVAALRDTIQFLDQPLRQVEIETMWVQISPQDANAFGINYNTSQGDFNSNGKGFAAAPADRNAPQLGFVRGNFGATLKQLVAANKARITAAPRVTTFNNAQADLQASHVTPAILKFENEANQVATLFEGVTYIGSESGISVTPTINNDDTVTLLMSLSSTLKMTTQNGRGMELSGQDEGIESIANVRDGDTIALSGYAPRFFPIPKTGAGVPAQNMLVFVTPRIVRRGKEDVKAIALPR